MQFLNHVLIEYLWFQLLIPLSVLLALASADRLGGHRHNHQASRQGRQEDSAFVCANEMDGSLPTALQNPKTIDIRVGQLTKKT